MEQPGDALIKSGMYAEAVRCYEKAIELNPRSSGNWNKMGLSIYPDDGAAKS